MFIKVLNNTDCNEKKKQQKRHESDDDQKWKIKTKNIKKCRSDILRFTEGWEMKATYAFSVLK